MKKYYKREWKETRGDEFYSWGTSIWYFEIGEDKYVIRQIEVYENKNRLKYDMDKKFDDYGRLRTVPLDLTQFIAFEINKNEFELEWKKSILK